MSTQHVDGQMVRYICANWDKEGCQDLLEALRAELKADMRKGMHPKYGAEVQQQLIGNVQDPSFWEQLELLLTNFKFDF